MTSSPMPPAFQSVLDAAMDAIIITDSAGRIGAFNSVAEKVFGYSKSEVIGKNVSVLMPASHAEQHQDHIERYLASGTGTAIGIARNLVACRKDGSTFPVQISLGAIPQLERPHFIAFMRDLSTEQLLEASRQTEMNSMTANLAHEINQPLAAIANYAIACERLLGMPSPDIAEVQDALRQISAQALRAGESIRRLREVIRDRNLPVTKT
jgi:two-component system, LuxR family, sensor kinase FixL